MEIVKQERDEHYAYSDDLEWQIHLNTKDLMDYILHDAKIRNSFKEWLDKQQ